MTVYASDTFNSPSGNVPLTSRTPIVGPSWEVAGASGVYACWASHPEPDARLRAISTEVAATRYVITATELTGPIRIKCDLGVRNTGSGGCGVIFRANGALSTYYQVDVTAGTCRIRRFNAGSETILASAAWTWAGVSTMKELKVEYIDNQQIKVYQAGVLLLDYTDGSPLTTLGRSGIYAMGVNTNAVLFDNFVAESIEAAPGVLTTAGTATPSFVGQGVTYPEATLTAAGTSSVFVQTFWFATGYLSSESQAAAAYQSVGFVTSTATLLSGGSAIDNLIATGEVIVRADMAGSAAFTVVPNSFGPGEALVTSQGVTTAAFVSKIVNGSNILSIGQAAFNVHGYQSGIVTTTMVSTGASAMAFEEFDGLRTGEFTSEGRASFQIYVEPPERGTTTMGGTSELSFIGEYIGAAVFSPAGTTTAALSGTQIFKSVMTAGGAASTSLRTPFVPVRPTEPPPAERIYVMVAAPRLYVVPAEEARTYVVPAEQPRRIILPAEPRRYTVPLS